jgi:hypothetical protein
MAPIHPEIYDLLLSLDVFERAEDYIDFRLIRVGVSGHRCRREFSVDTHFSC